MNFLSAPGVPHFPSTPSPTDFVTQDFGCIFN